MTADVYASDDDLNVNRPEPARVHRARIEIRADTDPNVLLRVSAQLNDLHCVPTHFVLEQDPTGEVTIQAVLVGCSPVTLEFVCRKLARLTCVYEVTSHAAEQLGHTDHGDGPSVSS